MESAHDGVGLQCARVAAAPPQVQPVPTVFDACVGKALIAVRPLPLEYDSQLDGVGPSRFVLEFDGGRRVCVSNVSGEIVCDRTGKAGGQLAG